MTIGYAVEFRGEIDIRTVGHSEVAAAVNWLCGGTLPPLDRILVLDGTSDEQVMDWFSERAERYGAKMAKVHVSVLDYVE